MISTKILKGGGAGGGGACSSNNLRAYLNSSEGWLWTIERDYWRHLGGPVVTN